MVDIVNILATLLSIGLGLVGWLLPRYTMEILDTAPTKSTMGLSEIRAASGALYVFAGVGVLLIGTQDAFAVLGFAWAGAAIGRGTSLLIDGVEGYKKPTFFVIELIVATVLILPNFP